MMKIWVPKNFKKFLSRNGPIGKTLMGHLILSDTKIKLNFYKFIKSFKYYLMKKTDGFSSMITMETIKFFVFHK